MDQLPPELIDYLCRFLVRPSLASFRLTCKTYAALAEAYFFHHFHFRLYPRLHRLHQLEQLAASPSIASRLRSISFESGVQLEYADYRYWQAQVYHEKSSAWERSLAAQGAPRHAYTEFHEGLQARFTTELPHRYDLYRWRLDQEAAVMAESRTRDVLVRTLNTLSRFCPRLQFIVVMAEPQIQLEELEAFNPDDYPNQKPYDYDPRRRVANRRQHCLDHFLNFLDAARLSNCELSDLMAIDVPRQLLTVNSIYATQVLEDVFRGLKRLDVSISELPHSDWLSRTGLYEVLFDEPEQQARRLRMLLNHPSGLEELSLEFPVGPELVYSIELFKRGNIDLFPRLWLPRLKSLTLCHFQCHWENLEAFLDEGKNLESLVLKHGRLETASMVDLLEYLPRRRIPSVSVLGTWRVDMDLGEWHSHSEQDFTACFAATSYEGPYARRGLRSRVEKCLRGEGDCPFPRWVENDVRDQWELMGDTSWHYIRGLPHHQ